MNPTPAPTGQQQDKAQLSEAAKASLARTHTLFRIFVVTVLGAFFVYQLNVSYAWLTAVLTAASLVLGVVLLVRSVRLKESRLILVGTICGMAVSAIMVLLLLATAIFFDEIREYQSCVGRALTNQAQSACQVQLERSLPSQLP